MAGKGVNMTSPLTAIRKHCVSCSGGAVREVTHCHIKDCDLYVFRFGVMPTTATKHGKQIFQAS